MTSAQEFQQVLINLSNEIDDEVQNFEIQTFKQRVSACIILPTYNEATNIQTLLDIIFSEEYKTTFENENINLQVLIVDDNSPDGTANVVKAIQRDNLDVHLLERTEKNGLGMAYIAGMQYAMRHMNTDILFEMDSDLSHGPEYLVPMINKVRDGADFVIGSRYIKGGSIPENWGAKRKLISKSANFFAKTVLQIKNVNDCTGGFRAIRTSTLEQIDLNSLNTKGYAFQISLLEEMRKNNADIREVPIHFKDRTSGTSKMKVSDMVEEGVFVLKAGFANMFSRRKTPNHNKNRSTNRFPIQLDEPSSKDDSFLKENVDLDFTSQFEDDNAEEIILQNYNTNARENDAKPSSQLKPEI